MITKEECKRNEVTLWKDDAVWTVVEYVCVRNGVRVVGGVRYLFSDDASAKIAKEEEVINVMNQKFLGTSLSGGM